MLLRFLTNLKISSTFFTGPPLESLNGFFFQISLLEITLGINFEFPVQASSYNFPGVFFF